MQQRTGGRRGVRAPDVVPAPGSLGSTAVALLLAAAFPARLRLTLPEPLLAAVLVAAVDVAAARPVPRPRARRDGAPTPAG
ncbi:hypothetical protein ACWFNE_07720 [Cellulomonas sp. NPDC055163]